MQLVHNLMVKLLALLLEVCMALLVLDVLLGVVSRYVMGSQVPWTEELACLLLVWSSFLGIALAFNSRAHLGIDLVVNMMDTKSRKVAMVFAHLVTIVFTIVVFLHGGYYLLHKALYFTPNEMPALHIPDAVMYLPIPIAGLFILFFELNNFAADLEDGKGKEA